MQEREKESISKMEEGRKGKKEGRKKEVKKEGRKKWSGWGRRQEGWEGKRGATGQIE